MWGLLIVLIGIQNVAFVQQSETGVSKDNRVIYNVWFEISDPIII